MSASSNDQLLVIALLKAELSALVRANKLDSSEYSRISQQLDESIRRHLPTRPLDELLNTAKQLNIHADLSVLKAHSKDKRIADIKQRRQQAITNSLTVLDLRDLHTGFEAIPLQNFDWQAEITGLSNLLDVLRNTKIDNVDGVIDSCCQFFGTKNAIFLPAGLPEINAYTIKRLLDADLVSLQNTDALSGDIARIQRHLSSANSIIAKQYFKGELDLSNFLCSGEFGLKLLLDQFQSQTQAINPLLLQFSIQWPYYRKAEIYKNLQVHVTKQSEITELLIACTGIDPTVDSSIFSQFLRDYTHNDNLGFRRFRDLLSEHRVLYELAYVFACSQLLNDSLEQHWWPVLQRLREQGLTEKTIVETIAEKTTVENTAAEKVTADSASPAESVERKASPPTPVPAENRDHLSLDDDIEEISAHEHTLSTEDEMVEASSTWNSYLKPFLHGNWVGLIGISSLLVAWLFFSMWIWDKGPFYRMLAGAIPLAGFTLGTGWICHFFDKRRDQGVSPQAVSLFSILCVFSIPFNYLIGASILESGGWIGITAGLGLALLYTWQLPLLMNWIKFPFGYNPINFIRWYNPLLYIPAIASLFENEYIAYAVDILIALAFIVTVMALLSAKRLVPKNFRFNGIVFTCFALLGVLMICIYYRFVPEFWVLGLLLQATAFVLLHFLPKHPIANVVGGSFTLLAILMCWEPLVSLAISLSIAAIYWYKQWRVSKRHWCCELFSFLLLALGVVVAVNFQLDEIGVSILVLASIAFLIQLERNLIKAELRLLTFSLPLFSIATLLLTVAISNPAYHFVPALCLAILTAYSYYRYVKHYRTRLWFLNIVLLLPLLYFDLYYLLGNSASNLLILLTGLIVLWLLLSQALKDPITKQQRSTVLLLYCLCTGATLVTFLFDRVISLDLLTLTSAAVIVGALILLSKRTQSSIGIYISLALVAFLIQTYREMIGSHGTSGLSLALAAAGILIVAVQLKLRKIWQSDKDTELFFGRNFFLHSPQYLYAPLQLSVWILTLGSIAKAVYYFSPMLENPKLLIALLIDSLLLFRFSYREQNSFISYAAMVPLLLAVASIFLSVPTDYQAIYVIILLIAFQWTGDFLLKSAGDNNNNNKNVTAVALPLQYIATAFAFLSMPAGLLAYYFIDTRQEMLLLIFAPLLICYTHWTMVSRIAKGFAHFIILHVVIVWWLLYSQHYPLWNYYSELQFSPLWLFGLIATFLLLFLPSYIGERFASVMTQYYVRASQYWLSFIVLLYLVSTGFLLLTYPDFPNLAYYTLIIIALAHLCNRYWDHGILQTIKALACIGFSYVLVTNLLWASILGLALFTILELVLHQSKNVPILRLQTITNTDTQLSQRLYLTAHLLVIACLLVHIFMFSNLMGGETDTPVPHYLLYALIPYCILLASKLQLVYLRYTAIILFAYTNIFVALVLLPGMHQYQLTLFHLISGVLVASIIAFLLLNKLVLRKLAL